MAKSHADGRVTNKLLDDVEQAGGEPPPQSALKDEWVAYAEAQGIDTDGLTKDEIIDAAT